MAISREIRPRLTRSARSWSSVRMPIAAPGRHRRRELVRLRLADQVADRRRPDHHLARGDAAAAPRRRQQQLRHDALERHRELRRICCCWWGGNASMMRSTVCGGVGRVQRREDQVAGLGGLERRRIVSRSRISPTRITSGSWRTRRSARRAKLSCRAPTSRWMITHFCGRGRTRSDPRS